MIEANELRVNNLYLHEGVPDSMTIHHLIVYIAEIWHPIPLTLEWLERCGFEDRYNHNDDGDEINWLEHPNMSGVTYRGDQFFMESGFTKLPHIQHVHQLQNLYFAITGEELPINLNHSTFASGTL